VGELSPDGTAAPNLIRGGRSAEKPVAEKPVEKEPGDPTIYRVDYSGLWQLPPPLPPRRLPIVRPFVLAGVVLGAQMSAVGD
jgi:hypothetical protein